MELKLCGRYVGDNRPCFIIAEAGVNHNGDLDKAKRLVEAAREAGADAVKFQTFRADKLATTDAKKADYQIQTTGPNESQRDMLARLALTEEAHLALLAHSKAHGMRFLSTPSDEASADFLATLGICAMKVSSADITDTRLLARIASKGLPTILSTGMSTIGEVEDAVTTIRRNGNDQLVLLQCSFIYPAPPESVNLRAMQTLRQAFGCLVGYSDHTLGIAIAPAAVALGACIVEKHLTLDRTLPGPDHRASLEPGDFRQMVQHIRTVEMAMGLGIKEPLGEEVQNRLVSRKSVVAAKAIHKGASITVDMLTVKRPGTGIPPAQLEFIVGHSALIDIDADQMLSWQMFGGHAQGRQ